MIRIDTLTTAEEEIVVRGGESLTLVLPILEVPSEPRRRIITLAGAGAEAHVVGLFLGHGDAELNVQIDTVHAAPNTRGRTEFKAVLADRSSLLFNGMIKIEPEAQGSNDFLQQDTLLLSADAKANSVPGLEIEANDVKASHGATAKPVDSEQKFYLMSRGVSESTAEAMIVHGFIAPILTLISDEWRQRILSAITKHFSAGYDLT